VPNLSVADQNLLNILSADSPTTIAGVIQMMQNLDVAMASNDGLKWFNKLYLMVTQAIDGAPQQQPWADGAWLTELDVIFAGLYFTALKEFFNGDPAVPSSWAALFEVRFTPNIDRIQFALAGMNAHINHDLALALVTTNKQMNVDPAMQSPEHDDYQRVNGILAEVLPDALNFLASDALGVAAQDTGKIGRLLAIWDVSVARDAAWDFGNHIRTLPAPLLPVALSAQDGLTGVIGRALLLPLQSA
jgi:hypothetical protein